MKSRIVALALAAVMTLGSCMSASAKEVFTKGLIGAVEVKNSAYVRSIDLIDIDIWNRANGQSLWTAIGGTTSTQASTLAGSLTQNTNGTYTGTWNNAYTAVMSGLTTEQQAVLLTIIENYGWDVAANTSADTAVAAPYRATWNYNDWVSKMQIAPFAERYIVGMNYENLYKNLKTLMDRAVAQGQITVSAAYSNSADYGTVKEALGVVDAKITNLNGGTTLSGATVKIGSFTTTVTGTDATSVAMVRVNGAAGDSYVLYPTFNGVPVTTDALTYGSNVFANTQYLAIPVTGTVKFNYVIRFYNQADGKTYVKTVSKYQTFNFNDRIKASDGTDTLNAINTLYTFTTTATNSYKVDVDNALAIATNMKKQFADAETYYKGQKEEGLAYLINNVRKDLGGKITKDNIDKAYGFDIDPYDNLKWEIGETKRIAFTSPTISDFTTGKSLIVLHFDTTACKWEAIDCDYINYNGVNGIEGTFSSCSPVIVVTLKNFDDAGAAAAAKATDAKKSPATGENF